MTETYAPKCQTKPILLHHHYQIFQKVHQIPASTAFESKVYNDDVTHRNIFQKAKSKHSILTPVTQTSKRSWKQSINPEVHRRYEELTGKEDLLDVAHHFLNFLKKSKSAQNISQHYTPTSTKPYGSQLMQTRPESRIIDKSVRDSSTTVSHFKFSEINKPSLTLIEQKKMFQKKEQKDNYCNKLVQQECQYLREHFLSHYESKHSQLLKQTPT